MRRSSNTSTARQGAHDALGSWVFVGRLRGAGKVAHYPFLGGFARRDNDR